MDNYEVTDARKSWLKYLFHLVVLELDTASKGGFDVYQRPYMVGQAVYLLLEQLGTYFLEE